MLNKLFESESESESDLIFTSDGVNFISGCEKDAILVENKHSIKFYDGS